MAKFVIQCPNCGKYLEANNGFFANHVIQCTCGHLIDVKKDRMASMVCPKCGNTVVYDQAKAKNALCPVCGAKLITPETLGNMSTSLRPSRNPSTARIISRKPTNSATASKRRNSMLSIKPSKTGSKKSV